MLSAASALRPEFPGTVPLSRTAAARPITNGRLICTPSGTVPRRCRHRGVARWHQGQNQLKVERHCLRRTATSAFRFPGFQDNLHEAAKQSNLRRVKRLLAAGSDVNEEDQEGWTPLLCAKHENCMEIVELLLSRGAAAKIDDVSPLYYVEGSWPFMQTEGHATALHFAVQHDNMDMVSALLSAGANINAPAHRGRTPLLWAIEKASLNMVALLLSRGADCVNLDNLLSDSYLGNAAQTGNTRMVKLLLSHGATWPESSFMGISNSPLMSAVESGQADMVELLLKNAAEADIHKKGGMMGETILMKAAATGKADIVQLILAAGGAPQLHIQSKLGLTVLATAAVAGSVDVVDVLLSHGAAVNEVLGLDRQELLDGDEDGDDEEEETDRLYLQFGKKGSTASVEAAKLGHLEVVMLLLSRGADVKSTTQGGLAFIGAVSYGHVEMAKLLIAHGADPDFTENNGLTALHIASFAGNLEGMRFLLSIGADVEATHQDPSAPHLNGWTPVFSAVNENQVAAMKVLVKHGARLDKVDKKGQTLLSLAAEQGRKESVEYLLKHGAQADLNVTDGKGKTPWEKAQEQQAFWAQQPAFTLADLMNPEGMANKPVRDYGGVFAALRRAQRGLAVRRLFRAI